MKHPIYLALGAITCLYLGLANLRGWSFWQTVSPARWGARAAGFHHK
jgi:hypothetical protein